MSGTSKRAQDRGLLPKAGRWIGAAALTVALTSCGITYNSPTVNSSAEGFQVTVLEMSPTIVASANRSPYAPQSLPASFFANAGGGSARGAGAIPPTPYLPDESRETVEFRPLPDVAPQPYRIGVGDELLLATKSRNSVEELSGLLAAANQRQGYTVRDDGNIAIPDVGSIAVAGLTIEEAENRLFQVLVDNQIDPTFSLEVSRFNSQRVAVGGAVRAPTIVPITPNDLTLGEAIIAAGGTEVRDREFASIRVYRQGTLYQIPLEIYLQNPGMKDKLMQAGDAVFVDTSYDLDRALEFYRAKIDVISLRQEARNSALNNLMTEINIRRGALEEDRTNFDRREKYGANGRQYVYLAGEVSDQNRFALPFNDRATLADVLYGEGGFDTTTGDPSEIYVLRGDPQAGYGDIVIAYHLNARNAAKLILATKFEMRPDDIIFIEEQPITKWNRALQQLFPVLLRSAQNAL
ncbi:polysaccharide biosynthesis/export family protein [Sagittula stellata]|uniref:Predicted exopolysaccharide export protein n=1 Tax=Sagittula stellata (strain ATCC 700073 / DSM 11524 / E-37) TaxID=388399 RepID=A3K5D1_SAGS3|nr:polysaccharide biosynthesis/export family protein [Sagittula stellata]EBA07732.1 predicted exopolysaccharide export protein [Sagittula stellata E-37]